MNIPCSLPNNSSARFAPAELNSKATASVPFGVSVSTGSPLRSRTGAACIQRSATVLRLAVIHSFVTSVFFSTLAMTSARRRSSSVLMWASVDSRVPMRLADFSLYPAIIAAWVAFPLFVRYASTNNALRSAAAVLLVPALTRFFATFPAFALI